MLIEYKGPYPIYEWRMRGIYHRFEPQERYGGAKVCDVTNKDTVGEMLRDVMVATGKPVFERFWADALNDPEFVRQVQRHPQAARHILEHPDEYPMDLVALKQELEHTPEEKLRLSAAQEGVTGADGMPHGRLAEALLDHHARRGAPEPLSVTIPEMSEAIRQATPSAPPVSAANEDLDTIRAAAEPPKAEKPAPKPRKPRTSKK